MPAGSVIISTRAPIGYTAVASRAMAFNQGCRGVVPRPSLVDGSFLRYCLQSLTREFQAAGTGSTFQELSTEALANARVPLPRIEEQRRVADFLDDQVDRLDELCAATKRQVSLAAEAFATRLAALLSGSSEGQVPLGRLLRYSPSYGVLKPEPYDGGDGVTLVRINDVDDRGNVDVGSAVRIPPEQSAEYRRTRLRAGDVMLSVVGTLGRSAVVEPWLEGANVSRALCRLVLRSEVSPRVVRAHFGLPAFARFCDEVTRGTAQRVLNMADVVRFPVSAVSPNSVLAVERSITALEALHGDLDSALSRRLAVVEERKRALITAGVTGKFDVSAASDRAGDAALAGLPR